jgi:hypothetical protein
MFTETLNKVTQGYISHTPLKMIQVSVAKTFKIYLFFETYYNAIYLAMVLAIKPSRFVRYTYCDNYLINESWHIYITFLIFEMFQSLTLKEKVSTLKFKDKSAEEPASYKNLLFWMVRLIHADPMLMLNVCIHFI